MDSPRGKTGPDGTALAARRDRFESRFRSGPLALAGAVSSVALLLVPGPIPRIAILLAAMAFARYSGRKVSPVGVLLVSAGIVAANLLVPVGRILFMAGPFPVTETALAAGIERAATFEALIHISRGFLRADIRVPGRIGALFGEALSFYGRIASSASSLRAKSLSRDLDDALLALYYPEESSGAQGIDAAGG